MRDPRETEEHSSNFTLTDQLGRLFTSVSPVHKHGRTFDKRDVRPENIVFDTTFRACLFQSVRVTGREDAVYRQQLDLGGQRIGRG